MSAHGFRPVFMAASVAGAALGCYLVSLNVASERAKLENVEEKIVLAQRDIRVLQTEIGTRGRLAQLERWNARFIRLSAPSADQFVEGGYQGYLSSEWEGHAFSDLGESDPIDLVKKQHALMRRAIEDTVKEKAVV